MTPSFLAAQQAGTNFSNSFRRVNDENAIESILAEAMKSGNPEELHNTIGKIMSNVSPERQGPAIQYIQNMHKNLVEKQKLEKQNKAYSDIGLNPNLPESINKLTYEEQLNNQRAQSILGGQQNNQPSTGPFNYNDLTDEQLTKLSGVKGHAEPSKQALKIRAEEKKNQSRFEPESDKIEAKRSADFADKIVNEYQGALASEPRLDQMLIGAKSGNLATPAMVKTMDFLGIPLSVFANPLSEAYEKNVNEYIKGVSNYFPGQIRNAEIEPYMKTIPTLLNSDRGKEIIIENQKIVNDQAKAAYKAYKDILKENNGKKPRNLDVEILDRTEKSRLENGEKLRENFIKAIKISQFPTGKVQKGTRIIPNMALNYLEMADGDRKLAEENAKKDGYVF